MATFPIISIIIPVYNTEKYIRECLDSILAQTYTNWEAILVDDGSTDNSGKICDEYAAKDNRFKVIHQENQGVTRARARGVEEASNCEFVTFVDGDDTLTNDALKTLSSHTNNNVDIVISAFDETYLPPIDHFTCIEYRHLAVKNEYYVGAACGKLIRRTLLNDFVFKIPAWIKVHEDTIMNIRIAFNTKNCVSFCKKTVYNYRRNEESVMHTFKKDLEYERALYEYIKASIPVNEHKFYIKDTIPYRLLNWRKFYMHNSHVEGMSEETFYIELRQDIKQFKIRLKFFEKILFYCTNPIIRYITIKAENACAILLSKIRRR